MGNPNFFGFDATDAKFQKASIAVANTFTDTGDLVTANAHGLSNGDQVVFQTIVTTAGLTTFLRYYVVGATTNTFQASATYGGSAVALTTDGTGTFKSIAEYDVKFVNKLAFANESKSFTYEGDGTSRKRSKLTGVTLTLDADCVSQSVRMALYGKSAITTGLPAGYTSGIYEGDSVETAGASCGLWVEGSATRVDATTGVETDVTLRRWFPLGVLTYAGSGDMNTSDKWGGDKYEFTASKTAVDVCGGALPSSASGGQYQYLMEKAA
jgi:hypothetical protein